MVVCGSFVVVCGVGIITLLGTHGERRLVSAPATGPCSEFVVGAEITAFLLLLNSSQIV